MKNQSPLAYSVETLVDSSGVGKTNIFAAIKCGDLKTITPVVNGKTLRRTLIAPEEAQRWIGTFPATESLR